MFSAPYTINARVGYDLARLASERGLDLGALARVEGLDPADFAAQDTQISLQAFAGLLDRLTEGSGDDCFGLKFGAAFTMGRAGAISFLLAYAPALGRAVDAYVHFQELVSDTVFFFRENTDGQVSLNWRYWPIIQRSRHYVDFQMTVTCRLIRRFTGEDWFPARVDLLRSPPRQPPLHHQLLGKSIFFESHMNAIAFPSTLLETANPKADATLYPVLWKEAETQLKTHIAKRGLRSVVTRKIMASLPMRVIPLAELAADLAMSPRNLQRRVAAIGTSFDRLVDETRLELSSRLLATSDLPVAEIGYLCGYADAPSYSRAASAWYGISPAAFRARMVSARA